MSDQTWAVIIGAAVVAVLRIIDFFFPKGRWYNWSGKSEEEDAKTDKKRRRIDKDSETARRKRDEVIDDD